MSGIKALDKRPIIRQSNFDQAYHVIPSNNIAAKAKRLRAKRRKADKKIAMAAIAKVQLNLASRREAQPPSNQINSMPMEIDSQPHPSSQIDPPPTEDQSAAPSQVGTSPFDQIAITFTNNRKISTPNHSTVSVIKPQFYDYPETRTIRLLPNTPTSGLPPVSGSRTPRSDRSPCIEGTKSKSKRKSKRLSTPVPTIQEEPEKSRIVGPDRFDSSSDEYDLHLHTNERF